MSGTSLKQQFINYSSLFRQLFFDYYRHQKKLFWLVQLFIVISTLTGIFWILSIILGISHYQNPANTEGFKNLLFSWLFVMPLWQWMTLASSAGLISAWTMYLSIQTGVKSALAYQKYISQRCLRVVAKDEYMHWAQEFQQSPRVELLRLLKLGVQLTGLVSRRITRAFVSLLTFIVAFIGLIYLDAKLLLLLIPLTVIYIIALYYINRYAARVSTEMADTLPISSSLFGKLVFSILNRKLAIDSLEFNAQFDDSLYMHQAELKYQRRLSEIHVSWLNTLFLVIGIAIIVVYIVYIQPSANIDWQHLLFFLIALKYAGSSLQQISATTVAFSRFMPEVQLVYRLLNVVNATKGGKKLRLNEHLIIYVPSTCLDAFEITQLNNSLQFSSDVSLVSIAEIREQGINDFFKRLPSSAQQNVIIDNNHERLKRIVSTHKDKIKLATNMVIIFSTISASVEQLSIDEFLNYNPQQECADMDFDMDTYE